MPGGGQRQPAGGRHPRAVRPAGGRADARRAARRPRPRRRPLRRRPGRLPRPSRAVRRPGGGDVPRRPGPRPRGPFTGVLFHGCRAAASRPARSSWPTITKTWSGSPASSGTRPPTSAANSPVPSAFAQAFEAQLSNEHMNPLFPLIHMMEEDERKFDGHLTKLRDFLQRRSVLLVLDNLESLLRDNGEWREPRWGRLVAALLSHRGGSRTVLTSRIKPVIPGLAPGKLRELPVHALGARRGRAAGPAIAQPRRVAAGRPAPAVGPRHAQCDPGAPEVDRAGREPGGRPGGAPAHLDRAGGLAGGAVDSGQSAPSSRRASRSWRPTPSSRLWPAGPIPSPPTAGRRPRAVRLPLLSGRGRPGGLDSGEVWPVLWKGLSLPGRPRWPRRSGR